MPVLAPRRYFPHHAHDDGPDALELWLEVLREIGWVMLDVAPPEAPTMTKPNSPAAADAVCGAASSAPERHA